MSNIRVNILKYASGTIISQALMVAATPILTRMFLPAEYGLLALFSSLYAILVNFSTLKFELSILLPKERRTAEELTTLIIALTGGFSAIVLAALLIVEAVGPWHIAWFYFFLPIAIMSGASLSAAQLWCSRDKDFTYTGLSSVVNVLGYVIGCAAIFWLGRFSGALIVGYTFGMLISALYICSRKAEVFRNALADLSRANIQRLRALFVEYRSFPLHVLPNMLLSSLSYQLVPIMMTHFFDISTIGLYSVANRLLVLPSILAAGAVGDVFRSEFVTRLHGDQNYRAFLDKALLYLAALAIPAYGGLWLLSPLLFKIFLGANYSVAGTYARYLCLGVAGNLFVQCFAYVFIALKETRISLILQALQAFLPLLGFLAGAYQGDITSALIYMSLTSFCLTLVFLGFVRRCTVRYTGCAAVCSP